MEIGGLKSKIKAKVNDPRLDQMKEDLEDAEETNKKLREDMRALRKKMKQDMLIQSTSLSLKDMEIAQL